MPNRIRHDEASWVKRCCTTHGEHVARVNQEFLAHDDWAKAHMLKSPQKEAIRHDMAEHLLAYVSACKVSSIAEQSHAWDVCKRDMGVNGEGAEEFRSFMDRFLKWHHTNLQLAPGIKPEDTIIVRLKQADSNGHEM